MSSRKRAEERAFRALGRLRVMRPTPGLGSEVRMCSYWVEVDWKRMREGRVRGEKDLGIEAAGLSSLCIFIVVARSRNRMLI